MNRSQLLRMSHVLRAFDTRCRSQSSCACCSCAAAGADAGPSVAGRRRDRHGQHARARHLAALRAPISPIRTRNPTSCRSCARTPCRNRRSRCRCARTPSRPSAFQAPGTPSTPTRSPAAIPASRARRWTRSGISPCCREAWDGKGEFPSGRATYYGGYTQSDVKPTPDSPLQKLGIDKVPPIVTSAVLLDAKTHLGGGKAMQPGAAGDRGRHRGDAQGAGAGAPRPRAPATCSTSTPAGAITGKIPDTEKFYYTKGPGLSYDAAKYIEQKAVVLVALDNPFTDPVRRGLPAGQGAAAAGHAGRPAVRDPSPQSDGRRHPQHPERQSRRPGARTRSGCPAPSSCRCARRARPARRCGRSRSARRRSGSRMGQRVDVMGSRVRC